ncbi:MAG: ankyrin repeat domain-containing protein [Chromatiales bacterium]|nr:ankyrin repeat domain-containing protein [Chromatiales bacterium]
MAKWSSKKQNLFSVLAALLVSLPVTVFAENPALIEAAKSRDLSTVQSLLADGVDPNVQQADGATALHWAVFREDSSLVEVLLESGADVNAVNRLGASPLFIAAKSGAGEMVARLVDAGADPNLQLEMGETPLMTAARSGTATGVRRLIEAGADVNVREKSRDQTALMWAAAQGHLNAAQALVDAGADLEARSKVRPMLMFTDATNGGAFDQGVMEQLGGFTPLLFAARQGDVRMARLLLNAGADIDGVAGNGVSPLVLATHSGHSELARFLIEQGADTNSIGAGYTALHAAILRGDLEVVNALLDHGADPNTRLQKANPVQRASEDWVLKTPLIGATPYWIAASFREPSIMRALAEAGADPSLTNEAQYRRLRERAERENPPPPEVIGGYASTVQAAVRGDSTRQRYYVQANPDPVGEERLALESVEVAIEHGVNLDHTDFTGSTALHDAAARNLATVVRALAERGADINVFNARGQTPLDLAVVAERRLGVGILALETPEYVGPTARQVLEELGAVSSN